MKTKLILLSAVLGLAALSVNSARADIRFGVSVGIPAPVVVVAAPAPVVYVGPVAPAPIVEVTPACPGVGYVWAPGYWAHRNAGFVWVRGGWNNHPGHDHRGYYHDDHYRYDHR